MSWTKKEDIFLKKHIGKITYEDIAEKLKKSKRTISYRVDKLGIKGINLSSKFRFKKKYSVNDNFFSKVNLINSYYAGLIASDGCVRGNTISLTQSESRLYVIKRFVKDINYNGKIYKSHHTKGHNSFTVVISSVKLKQDLKNNFNIIEKKSLILTPPKFIDNECKLSFIVGLIDGDGTIGFYNKKKDKKTSLISLCGTYDMTKWVFDIWKKECLSTNKRKNSGPRQITNNNTWVVSISGISVIKFYELIENLNIPKMETKWNVFPEEFKLMGKDFYLKDFSKDRKKYRNGKFI
jgi:DNA-binding Lrp family transcriptional regulator